jgi:hypothetical protein
MPYPLQRFREMSVPLSRNIDRSHVHVSNMDIIYP